MSDQALIPTEMLKDAWKTQDRMYADQWWLKKYWTSTEGAHRDAIIRALEGVADVTSVLEIGCNTGPNLRRIHARWPSVDLMGMDIHPGAIRYGRARAHEEGWHWAGYCGDLRELDLLGNDVADVVLTCYSLAYLDPRDIDQALAAALACARRALIICEPMVLMGQPEKYAPPHPGVVPEYHFSYQDRLVRLDGAHRALPEQPIQPPEGRLTHILTVLK